MQNIHTSIFNRQSYLSCFDWSLNQSYPPYIWSHDMETQSKSYLPLSTHLEHAPYYINTNKTFKLTYKHNTFQLYFKYINKNRWKIIFSKANSSQQRRTFTTRNSNEHVNARNQCVEFQMAEWFISSNPTLCCWGLLRMDFTDTADLLLNLSYDLPCHSCPLTLLLPWKIIQLILKVN